MGIISRFNNRRVKRNRSVIYEDFRRRLGRNSILQYRSPTIRYPTQGEIQTLNIVTRPWEMGDRFEKLAAQFYDDPEMWWVIAAFNKKPAEFLLSPGDIINIPLPLEYILDYMGY